MKLFLTMLAAGCALGSCVADPDDDRRRRPADASDEDAGEDDAGQDGGRQDDGGARDAGQSDAGAPDAGDDAGQLDDAGMDAGPPDAGEDGGGDDAGSTDAGPGDPLPPGTSIEFGRTLYGNDDAIRSDVPPDGMLFSVWTKIPDPPTSSYPWVRGNMDVYVLVGDGWHLRCLVGNIHADSASDARYNANSMLFADPAGTWVDDYSWFMNITPMAESATRGWVWVAWQVIVENDAFLLRQWLKFGVDGPVFAAGESRPTFADVRNRLVSDRGWSRSAADAWTPGPATDFQVGSDNGYLFHARMDAMNSTPPLTLLEEIAGATLASTAAWADYALVWHDGAPDLADLSGHGRDLVIESGGTLYPGPLTPR